MCPFGCRLTFPSVSECAGHAVQSHGKARVSAETDALIKLSSQYLDVEKGLPCPLCGETLKSFRQYQHHVGRHQEQLALFALPNLESNGESDFSENESHEVSSVYSVDEQLNIIAKIDKAEAYFKTKLEPLYIAFKQTPPRDKDVREKYYKTLFKAISGNVVEQANGWWNKADEELRSRSRKFSLDKMALLRELEKARYPPSPEETPCLPASSSPPPAPPSLTQHLKSQPQETYFIPGEGINREVIIHDIKRYMGVHATVEPGTQKVRLCLFTPPTTGFPAHSFFVTNRTDKQGFPRTDTLSQDIKRQNP